MPTCPVVGAPIAASYLTTLLAELTLHGFDAGDFGYTARLVQNYSMRKLRRGWQDRFDAGQAIGPLFIGLEIREGKQRPARI
jgi:hypothetical protein